MGSQRIIDDLGAAPSGRTRPRRPWRARVPRPSMPSMPSRPPAPSRRVLAVVAAAGLLVVVAVYAIGSLLGSDGDDHADGGGASPQLAADAGPNGGDGAAAGAGGGAEAQCAAPAGDPATGVGVIRALEHAYYAARDGAAVRALIADGSPAATPAQRIQAGIDTIPVGTTYCLAEARVSPTSYSVSVTEHRPGGDTVAYEQRFQVRKAPDGTWAVTAIAGVSGA